MNRFIALALAAALLFGCTSCVGKAAGPLEHPAPLEEQTSQPPELALLTPPIEEEPEEEELYVRSIDPTKPMVALTFDDGPHATYSDLILDVLEENHAVATFFEVGRNVARCPEVLVRENELGCEIASHSNAHKDLSKLSKSALLADLEAADEAFIDAVGFAPSLVRPPYGAVNKAVQTETGRTMITWNVDTLDWKSRDAQAVIDYVQGMDDLDGDVILMHSIYESTAEATAVLVPWLQEQGYQLVTVTELLAYYYGELPQANKLYGYTYFHRPRTETPLELPEAGSAS